MNRHRLPQLASVAALALCAAVAMAYDGNPPSARTGAPAMGGKNAEQLCTSCHGGHTVNTGGSVTLVNPPAYYVPGTVYTLTLQVESSGTAANSGRKWGFQLTAINAGDGTGAGTFANVSGQGTMIGTGSGSFATRQYVEVSGGNHAGAASPVSWQVQWTAPNPGVGEVQFHFAGLAANGSGSSGDWVYSNSYAMPDAATPALKTTWGSIKARYR